MPPGRPKKIPEENSAKKAAKKPIPPKKPPKEGALRRQGDYIFSLDIGTRTIVGIVGKKEEDTFHVLDKSVIAHTKRAMIDGQIEDIEEVSKMVKKVKIDLENRLKIRLSKVSIAAAGRALKTQHVKVNIDIDGKDNITDEMVKSFEIEAITQAQGVLDSEKTDETVSFYCVGHSVVNYFLDDYPIKNLVGHKGKIATVDMLAAFLPSVVVESLYSVMDMNKLTVESLTLEPIAAMNVIVPPEVRLINVALVDIGAGTSDIAIAKNGSIVAYAMATIAGDEISEEIIRRYLVDFTTAETMKMSSLMESIVFKDILGFEHTISSKEFYQAVFPAVDLLASTIVENILLVNGESPSAVFLVGGGSQVVNLAKIVAKKLDLPENRVAVGGYNSLKNINMEKCELKGPEFVTPIGIAVTATLQDGYDFSTVTLNKKKVRVFNTNQITILDLLGIAGYKSASIIGRSGRNLTFTLNGETKMLKGGMSASAIITVNNIPSNINSIIRQGDDITIIPAVSGQPAAATIQELIGDTSQKQAKLAGITYDFGIKVTVNGSEVSNNYLVQNFDDIRFSEIKTLGQLLTSIPTNSAGVIFLLGKRRLPLDYILNAGDEIEVIEIPPDEQQNVSPMNSHESEQQIPPENILEEDFIVSHKPAKSPSELVEETPILPPQPDLHVTLNGRNVAIPRHTDGQPNLFLEITAIANIDTSKPEGTGELLLTLNSKNASYMDILADGDKIFVGWKK